MPTKEELGRRLRSARFERGLTLKEVATRCGMSATHISEVERGKTSPTIGALQRIAAALGEKPSYFVREDTLPRVLLTRESERCTLLSADAEKTPIEAAVISRGIPGGNVQVFEETMEPGSTHRHDGLVGEAVVVCFGGMGRIAVGDNAYVLREGDTVQHSTTGGWTTESIGDEALKLVIVLAAPVPLRI